MQITYSASSESEKTIYIYISIYILFKSTQDELEFIVGFLSLLSMISICLTFHCDFVLFRYNSI